RHRSQPSTSRGYAADDAGVPVMAGSSGRRRQRTDRGAGGVGRAAATLRGVSPGPARGGRAVAERWGLQDRAPVYAGADALYFRSRDLQSRFLAGNLPERKLTGGI